MKRGLLIFHFLAGVCLLSQTAAWAGQVPAAASDPDIPVSHRDRVYSAEQFSNTVSVTDPVDNRLVGVIRLGDPQPGNFSPLYKGLSSSTAWVSRPTIKPLLWCRSAVTP